LQKCKIIFTNPNFFKRHYNDAKGHFCNFFFLKFLNFGKMTFKSKVKFADFARKYNFKKI